MTFRLALFLAVLVTALAPLAPAGVDAAETPPVVVELYTAQGCRNCPPADAYFAELARRDDVLALGFHVDYWNYIGWADPLAFKAATERQRAYRRRLHLPYIYTPEIIVGGSAEGVGSERHAIDGLIADAKAHQPPHPALHLARRGDGALVVEVGALTSAQEPATLWLVGYGKPRTTSVPEGENAGKLLTDYQPVHAVESIGTWSGKAMETVVSAAQCDAAGDGGLAVLLQSGGDGPILTAARLETPSP
jgi:hypothetical protein